MALTLFLCGDVMTGRGIDQVLAHAGDPHLDEPSVRDAGVYVELAERAHGPIPRPASGRYIWGDALGELARVRPDARIVNLETAITRSDDLWPGKEVHYRMHPDNIDCITSAAIDCCALANNHVLDYGRAGLIETLRALDAVGVKTAGAGRNAAAARSPAVVDVPSKGRVLVFAFGMATSGIPESWAATDDRPGVSLLDDLSNATIDRIRAIIDGVERPGDVVVVSIHWGSNWGYDVPAEHVRFAHALVRTGVDVIHGHSSHHVRPIEVFAGKLILYGCGDFVNDYEGIGTDEEFRGDLTAMYFATLDGTSGRLADLRVTPMKMRRFTLNRASREDAAWLRDTIDRESRAFDFRVALDDDGRLRWRGITARLSTGSER